MPINSQHTQRSPRNKTITLTATEHTQYRKRLLTLTQPTALSTLRDKTLCQDLFEALPWLPPHSVDLLFADPPYNLDKTFGKQRFTQRPQKEYADWLYSWLAPLRPILKPTASLYICGDWRASAALHSVLADLFNVRNRITWEREKGRGAKHNWKNCAEDIWFCTMSNTYTFNVNAVKLKRRVIAPYTHRDGSPKDWDEAANGRFRLTHPANLWTDLTVPFWSMPENTPHPTQKPEKLLAKIILASSNPDDIVLDPFLGSGTTSVVAKKLHRHYIGIEIDADYACIAEKRLDIAETAPHIQGYTNGYFWERNTLARQQRREEEERRSRY